MAEKAGLTGGKAMTDEERLALCNKMDKELDEFIDSLEKKKYEDGWPEDRWEEEMDKHPFFMKQAPGEGDVMSPLTEGLAQLKYDPEENTPDELANNYREEGNFNFKHKNYKLALLSYTEGIKIKCGNPITESSLCNNRAAAHWQLENFRSSLLDCERALHHYPFHKKARSRAVKAALKIADYDRCIDHCQHFKKLFPDDTEIIETEKEAIALKRVKERDSRKVNRVEERNNQRKEEALKIIIARGINLKLDGETPDISWIEPIIPELSDAVVCFEDDQLFFPIQFLYPEFQIKDLIKKCSEEMTLSCIMDLWSSENRYDYNSTSLYFKGDDGEMHKVSIHDKVKEILIHKHFVLVCGTLVFFVVKAGSETERQVIDDTFL